MIRLVNELLVEALSQRASDVVQKYVCDVYEPNLEKAVDRTEGRAKPIRDFRLSVRPTGSPSTGKP